MPLKNCEWCGVQFKPGPYLIKRGGGRFCSYKCRGLATRKNEYSITCSKCGNKFQRSRDSFEKCCRACVRPPPEMSPCYQCGAQKPASRKFCDQKCRAAYRIANAAPRKSPKANSICATCGKDFYAVPSHLGKGWGKYCSMKCRPIAKHVGAGKGGVRSDLGIYVRSTWEANYARYLNWLKSNNLIVDWKYEPKTFYFDAIKRGTRSYTPDFLVTELSGREVFHEVKGYMDQKSRTKLRRMAKYYPEIAVLVIEKTAMRDIREKLSGVIPNWEFGANDKLGRRRVQLPLRPEIGL